jgi:hypothetical protein
MVVSRFRRARLPTSIIGFFNGAFQPHLDQMQHAPINSTARHRLHEVGIGDASEVVRKVGVDDVGMATVQLLRHLDHRLLGVAPSTIGVDLWWKISFEDRLADSALKAPTIPGNRRPGIPTN